MSVIGGSTNQRSYPSSGYRTITVRRNLEAATSPLGGSGRGMPSGSGKPLPMIFADLTREPAKIYVVDDISSEALYRAPSAFNKAQMAAYSTINTSRGRLEVSNAGYVSASFDIGGGQWYLDGLDGLSGPARAAEITERLASRFGGEVRSAPTAITQKLYGDLQARDITSAIQEDYQNATRPAKFETL